MSISISTHIRGDDCINLIPRPGENEMKCPSSYSEARGKKRENFFFLLSDLVRPSLCWVMSKHIGEGNSLY